MLFDILSLSSMFLLPAILVGAPMVVYEILGIDEKIEREVEEEYE